MDQRIQFIADYLRDSLSVTELCHLYGISRKTAYKWINRYLRLGPAGLEERSRRPRRSPNETAPEIVAALLEARRRHPSWGSKKLLTIVQKRHPRWHLPARATVCEIFKRHGMVLKSRRRWHIGHPGKPTSSILAPNDLWSADFKKEFKTGDGIYCYPPHHRRWLQPLSSRLSGPSLDGRGWSKTRLRQTLPTIRPAKTYPHR